MDTQPPVQHPIVRQTEDAVIYRASAAGGCLRALCAARLGMDARPPPSSFSNSEGTGYFDQGNEAEPIVKALLTSQGFTVYDDQLETNLRISDITPENWATPTIIQGHIDGLCMPGDTYGEVGTFEHLLEIKAFGSSNWDLYKSRGLDAFPTYKFQVSSYMYALELADLAFVVYNKESGELDISLFERPPLELWELELKILQVEQWALLGEPIQTVACTNNYPCPYYYIHDTPEELSPALLAMARVYKAASVKQDQLQAIKDRARDKLLAELNSGKYASGAVSVTVVEPRRFFDSESVKALMREAGIDPEEYMKTGDQKSVRVNIKEGG